MGTNSTIFSRQLTRIIFFLLFMGVLTLFAAYRPLHGSETEPTPVPAGEAHTRPVDPAALKWNLNTPFVLAEREARRGDPPSNTEMSLSLSRVIAGLDGGLNLAAPKNDTLKRNPGDEANGGPDDRSADILNELSNGGFENGSDGAWSESSSLGLDLILTESEVQGFNPLISAQQGEYLVWLGGGPEETSSIRQTLFLGSTNPETAYIVDFHYIIGSVETNCGADIGEVLINGTVIWSSDLCGDTSTLSEWERVTLDVTQFAGTNATLEFKATTDNDLNSNFFIDSVSLLRFNETFQNGNFESGRSGEWVEFSTNSLELILNESIYGEPLPVSPRSGDYLAWLGGVPDEISFLTQNFVVPEIGSGGTLSFVFYYQMHSTEDGCENDGLAVWINSEPVWILSGCQTNNTGFNWTKGTIDLAPYAGELISLDFGMATNDNSLNSSFYIDDVGLEGTGSPATPLPPTATPVAPTPTLGPPPSTPVPGNGIKNSGFELGANGDWTVKSPLNNPVIQDPVNPDIFANSGDYLAWIGFGLDYVESIEQTFIVPRPATADTVTELHFHYLAVSFDPVCANDKVEVLLNGRVVFEKLLCLSTNTKAGWTLGSVDLAGFVGQQVTLEIRVINDALEPSTFLVDDVLISETTQCELIEAEPNNLPADADDNRLMPNCDLSTVSGRFTASDDIWDIYKLVPDKDTQIALSLSGIPSGSDYELYLAGADGIITDASLLAGDQQELILKSMEAGETYYIGVFSLFQGAEDERYRLELRNQQTTVAFGSELHLPLYRRDQPRVTPTPTPPPADNDTCSQNEAEPNDKRSDSNSRPLNMCGNLTIRGNFGPGEAELINDFYFDNFYMVLDEPATVVINLTGIPDGSDYDIILYEALAGLATNGPRIADSESGGNQNESIRRQLPAGSYHVSIRNNGANQSTQNYSLRIVLE